MASTNGDESEGAWKDSIILSNGLVHNYFEVVRTSRMDFGI